MIFVLGGALFQYISIKHILYFTTVIRALESEEQFILLVIISLLM